MERQGVCDYMLGPLMKFNCMIKITLINNGRKQYQDCQHYITIRCVLIYYLATPSSNYYFLFSILDNTHYNNTLKISWDKENTREAQCFGPNHPITYGAFHSHGSNISLFPCPMIVKNVLVFLRSQVIYAINNKCEQSYKQRSPQSRCVTVQWETPSSWLL